jgi:hypothetical protein
MAGYRINAGRRSGPRAWLRRWQRRHKARRRGAMPTRTLVLIIVYGLTGLALSAWIFMY